MRRICVNKYTNDLWTRLEKLSVLSLRLSLRNEKLTFKLSLIAWIASKLAKRHILFISTRREICFFRSSLSLSCSSSGLSSLITLLLLVKFLMTLLKYIKFLVAWKTNRPHYTTNYSIGGLENKSSILKTNYSNDGLGKQIIPTNN